MCSRVLCLSFILSLFFDFVWLDSPAATCVENVPPSTPAALYTDNGDGTITDMSTNLMWIKCVEGLSGSDCYSGAPTALAWEAALAHAHSRIYAGHEDWRLPNIKELASIVDLSCTAPAIKTEVFINFLPICIWSASPQIAANPETADNSLGICFNTGDDFSDHRINAHYVLLVRDAVVNIAGDVNLDGSIDLKDVIISLQTVTGSNNNNSWSYGDADGDGKIGMAEVLNVLIQTAE